MPRKLEARAATSQVDASEQLKQMAAFNDAAVEIFTQACQAYAVGVATLNGEIANFVNARVSQDVELGQALCRCGKWSDAMDLHQDWMRRATQEYLSEASRLIDLASKVTKNNWEPIYERTNDTLIELGKTKTQ